MLRSCLIGILLLCNVGAAAAHATHAHATHIAHVVKQAITPLMVREGIPGMAVGVIVAGRSYVYDFGVASPASREPVTNETLFEVGSVSKLFTATLVSLADAEGTLSLSNAVEDHVPSLHGTAFGKVTLLELGTHTPGGLPLDAPDAIKNEAGLIRYLKAWRAACAPGTCRTYSNIGIGMLGLATARAMHQPFTALVREDVFKPLRMRDSWYDVPPGKLPAYAEGMTAAGRPIRVAPGLLDAEAWGLKTSAADLLRFLAANMGSLAHINERLQHAITATHTSYFRAGPMTQDLVWEQYAYPVSLDALLAGNSVRMLRAATPVARLSPPLAPREDVWINKTGTTNGFSAYVAFVPAKRLGIVLLANRNFPVSARVTAAYAILSRLDADDQ